jgi:hypothetical protein
MTKEVINSGNHLYLPSVNIAFFTVVKQSKYNVCVKILDLSTFSVCENTGIHNGNVTERTPFVSISFMFLSHWYLGTKLNLLFKLV